MIKNVSDVVVMCTCQQLLHLCKNYFLTILQYTKNIVRILNCSIPQQKLCEDNKKRVTEAFKILDAQRTDKVHPRSLETNHETISVVVVLLLLMMMRRTRRRRRKRTRRRMRRRKRKTKAENLPPLLSSPCSMQ